MYYKVWETAQISKKLLQSVTKNYYKVDKYYKVRRICYKVWQVLQNVAIVTDVTQVMSFIYFRSK